MTGSEDGAAVGLSTVRAALREALVARGFQVASDTLGLRRDLYLIGDNDLARALFEFHETADDAAMSMYQGAWTPGLPPRFAVVPSVERSADSVEMLEQIRATPLFFGVCDDEVTFDDLDTLLAEHLKE